MSPAEDVLPVGWSVSTLGETAAVVKEKTSTITEPLTAGSPLAAAPPPATELTSGRSIFGTSGFTVLNVVVAVTEMPLSASSRVTCVDEFDSTSAWVWTAGRMLTTTAPPTPVPLIASAPPTAID